MRIKGCGNDVDRKPWPFAVTKSQPSQTPVIIEKAPHEEVSAGRMLFIAPVALPRHTEALLVALDPTKTQNGVFFVFLCRPSGRLHQLRGLSLQEQVFCSTVTYQRAKNSTRTRRNEL